MVLYLHDAIAQSMTPTCLRRRLYVVFHVPHKLPVPDIAGTRVHTRVGDKYIGQKLISHVRSMIWCHVQRASHMAMPLMTLNFMNSHSANQKGTQTYTDVRIFHHFIGLPPLRSYLIRNKHLSPTALRAMIVTPAS